jgi:ribonuclease J
VVRLLPLGGLDEDGKNMLVIEINDDIYIVEAGIKFPDAKQALGIECITPDFSYLIENKDRIRGILITHGHDDVMASLPFLLKEIKADVYVSPFTSAVVSKLLKKNKVTGARLKTVKRNDIKKIGGRQVVFFPLTHSYPQAYGFGIKTDHGFIVYSGEFVIDYNRKDELYGADFTALSKFRKEGVMLLLQDSKGADRSGSTAPHHEVGPSFSRVLQDYEHKRIFVEIYTQSVFRIQEIIQACVEQKRKICFYTKPLQELIAGLESITETVPPELVVPASEINNLENAVVIIAGQGRPLFQLMSNIANNEVDDVTFRDDDVIVVATPLVPGVEKDFKSMENDIYKRQGAIIKIDRNVIGMHPSKEDLKMMIYMTDPDYYMPIKGEYRMLCANAMIAQEQGIDPSHIIILDNGEIATFIDGVLQPKRETLELHDNLIDGNANWDMAGVVLKDREILSTDGVIILAIGLDFKTKKIINGPDIQTRGLVYVKDAEYLTKESIKIMEDTIEEMLKDGTYENMECRSVIRDRVGKYVFKQCPPTRL